MKYVKIVQDVIMILNLIQKLRQHEHTSEHLKTLRFSLKDLEKDYQKTEDDIKAVQSVGQIIGEVMKQLDDERCAHTHSVCRSKPIDPRPPFSYREGILGASLCRLLPPNPTCRKAQDGDARQP